MQICITVKLDHEELGRKFQSWFSVFMSPECQISTISREKIGERL